MEDAWMVFALDQSINQMRHVPTRVDIESACVRARETMNGTQPPTAEQQPPTRARQANRHGGEDHLAFALRGREGPESRSARLGDNRVDFIRGKDFYATLRTRKDLLDELVPIDGKERSACEADAEREKRVTDARIQRCGQALLQRGYLIRCERVFKDPRKGRVKLVKFPHYLQRTRDQTFTEDAFYAWTYTPPMSWTSIFVSALFAFGVVAMCLFPLAPIWFKKVILYVCLSILGTFAVVFSVRAIVFVLVWIVTGEHFWILPNLTDDEIPINELFTPPWGFDPHAKKIGLLQRFVGLSIGSAVVYGLYSVAPETGGAVANLNRAHDSILDLFNLKDGPKSLGGAMNATSSNATDAPVAAETSATLEVNVTAEANETEVNATVIPSLDEILAEVGDDFEDEPPATEPKTEL
jgi:translocation protein SEC62